MQEPGLGTLSFDAIVGIGPPLGLPLGCRDVAVEKPVAPSFLYRLPLALKAFAFAREVHREQRRESDAAPFIAHPLEVASLLYNTAHPDHVVAAGILHDTIENSDVTIDDVQARFGAEVAGLVAAMSEDPSIEDFGARKAALRRQIAECGPDAAAVYAADKVAKVRELRSKATRDERLFNPPDRATVAKLKHYLASLTTLERLAPDQPLVRQLRFELEMLHALPPRPELLAHDP